jgi:hypothetical protein
MVLVGAHENIKSIAYGVILRCAIPRTFGLFSAHIVFDARSLLAPMHVHAPKIDVFFPPFS